MTCRAKMAIVLSVAFAGSASAQVRISSVVKTLYFGVETPTPDPAHPETVDLCHTDIDIPYASCAWRFAVSADDQPATPGNPDGDRAIDFADALLYVNPAAQWNSPSIPSAFAFIGAVPNETFWILPQSYDPNVLYLGFASDKAMTPAELAALAAWNPGDPRNSANVNGKWIRVQLVDVRGPAGGHFSVWQTDDFGSPVAYISTYDGGITSQDVYHDLAGSHSHMNWGFTKPGLYEIDIQVSTYIVGQLNAPRFDEDGDGDVDQTDFGAFQRCLSGAGQAYGCGCAWADGDVDGDVDADDMTRFEACASGPSVAASVDCND